MNFKDPCVWDALKATDKPIILYGMGNGADKVLDEFEKRNIKACGVMASDDFVRYQNFRGFTVSKMCDFEKQYDDFLIALCFASSLDDVMNNIKRIASIHPMLVPNVPVYGKEVIDDAFIVKYKNEIKHAYSLLCDEKSKEVFVGALNFLYSGKIEYLKNIESDKDEIFHNVLCLSNSESYLDLGAYRGDTVDEFLHYTHDYKKIVAVEPNIKNHTKLTEHCEQLKNLTVINAGITDKNSTMFVSKGGGRQSVLNSKNGVEIATINVDTITELYGDFSYIKADIEGMESKMLQGAKNTLKTRPKLNIAGYHTNSDFFTLINKVHVLNPDYKIYLRKHPYIPCWDLNIYCI
ncbi:MAG: FkbM family methyltransferase [Ruminococcaceae bacterium]|nr:FkbM family methyltransferase [Oscillospiraceae bacterium]